MIQLLIDADPMVYRNGFAAQHNVYHVVAEDASGKLFERYFRGEAPGQQIAQWLTQYHLVQISKDVIVEPEPVDHALYLVKQEIAKIVKATKEKHGRKRVDIQVFLSGPGNFREGIAKQRPYKGNRDPEHKPVHYQAIRDYIADAHGGIVVHGREADDEVSIRAWRADCAGTVVATIDKDLDQIPGLHFNYQKNVFYDVSKQEAKDWFWMQCLAGDPTDNVPGAYKVGPTKAKQFVDELKGLSEHDIWYAIERMYEATARNVGCPYTEADAKEVALETARLVYMQQKEYELWTPPGVPMGTIGGGGLDD